MRHLKNKQKIGGASTADELLYRNLANSLIMSEKIKTTAKKARLTSSIVEKAITASKKANLSSKRNLHDILKNKEAEKKVRTELVKRYKDKKGGYSRILKIGRRQGDGAKMVQLELL